jgi:FAD/FMN-containing dehydrogenase
MFVGAMYPLETARSVVAAWRDFMDDAPEEVSSQAVFWSVPEVPDFPDTARGEPVVAIVATHCGPVEDGRRVLQPLRELAEPLVDLSGPAPYTQVQQLYDPFFPEGELYYYWKSIELAHLDDEVIEEVVAAAADRPSSRTLLPIWHHGGAMNRVGALETAYGDRSATYLLSIDSTWADPDETEANVEWTRTLWDAMHRFSDGGLYLNFPGYGEEGEELVRAGHGEAVYDRLVDLKDEYDPDNLFRLNQNVSPSS